MTENGPTTIAIDAAVVDEGELHPLAGWLYVVIARQIQLHPIDAFPSVATLAKLANMSRASVLRYTKVLELAKLITVRRDEKSGDHDLNHYELLPAPIVVSDSNHSGICEIPQTTTEPEEVVSDSNPIKIKDKNKAKTKDKKQIQRAGARRDPPDWQQIVGLFMEFLSIESGTATRFAELVTGKARSGIWAASKLTVPADLRELKGWRRWIEQSHRQTPRTAAWVQESFRNFRASSAYQDAIRDANDPPPPQAPPEAPPPPEVTAKRQQDYRAQIAQLALAKTLTPERTIADVLRSA